MDRNTVKIIIHLFFCFFVISFLVSCHNNIIIPDIDNENNEGNIDNNINIYGYLLIKDKSETDIVKDCTPEFNIFTEKENIVYMSFSGDGKDWSKWINYSENYDQFNIASGLYGTSMESGIKTIYVRFKDINGIIYPQNFQEPICCKCNYEMQELFSIKIEPAVVKIKEGESSTFTLKGYDIKLNEVPLDSTNVKWIKSCDIGELNPITGLQTVYTAPKISGVRNISAYYHSLRVGARIYILKE
jgi:hypothetical protein